VTTKERIAIMPEMPTIAESGVPGFDVSSWFGSSCRQERRRTSLQKSTPTPTPRWSILGQPRSSTSAGAKSSTPAELAAFLKSEIDKWGRCRRRQDQGRELRVPEGIN